MIEGAHWWTIKPIHPEEVKWIEENGRMRNANGSKLGWKSKTPSSDDSFHINGLAGEWAVALVYDLKIRQITSSSARTLNAGGDLDMKIEVKASGKTDPRFWDLIIAKKDCREDAIYVHTLACWFPQKMVVTGWAYGHEILATDKIRHAAHRPDPLYCLEQKFLRTPMSLFDVIRDRKKGV